MDTNNSISRFFSKLKFLENIDIDATLFQTPTMKDRVARTMCLLGALIIFVVSNGLLPEKLDAILHHEILFLGGAIGILGMFWLSKLMAYILLAFLILAQTLFILYFYFTYYG